MLLPINSNVFAQESAPTESVEPNKKPSSDSGIPSTAPPTTDQVKDLQREQRVLADRFGKLEELFLRMSELEMLSNPTRASLLQQAAQLSKQLSTLQRLNLAADLLAKGQYSRALQEQESTRDSLSKLLELLQSENRQSRIRDDRERIEALIKDVQRLERLERSLRGRTEGGQERESAAKDQQDIQDQTQAIDKGLEEFSDKGQSKPKPDAKSSEPSADSTKDSEKDNSSKDDDPKDKNSSDNKADDSTDSKPSDSKPSDSKPSESKPTDSKPSSSNPNESKPSDSQPSDSDSAQSNSKDASSSENKSGSSESKKSPDAKPQTREEQARERLKVAQKKMEKAREKIEQDKRAEAIKEQQEAENELKLASEELEKILRQLREEEIERTLDDLESRLRKMLAMQGKVLDQTKSLIDIAASSKDRQIEIQISKLAIDERKIGLEGQKALLLLQDEGSSMAFPEALVQMNDDIASVADDFSKMKISPSSTLTQEEIIAALEELLESLTETKKKMEEKKREESQQNGGGGGGGQEDQPLVDDLAELRLIKTLQLRINKRTQRLATDFGLSDDPSGQATDSEARGQAQELATRQDKLYQVIRELLLKQAKQ